MHQVFISYSHEDQTVAERLYRDIKKAGHTPWIDTCDLQAGENWRYRITKVISECDYFLALLSKRSLSKRGFVQQELRLALEALQKFPVDDQFIIPVRIEVCCPKNLQLADIQWVDLFPDYAMGLERILVSMRDRTAMTSRGFFANVGIILPEDVSAWPDDHLFRFITSDLWPEAMNRAERDYENLDESGRRKIMFDRARDKLNDVAAKNGFADRLDRYWQTRNRAKTQES